MSAAAAKPVLRGFLNTQIKKNIVISTVIGLVAGYVYKVVVYDDRKKAYAEFYKTYDAEKAFQSMRAAGVFQSCSADD